MICFCIDECTPCLTRVSTGEICKTEVITLKNKTFLKQFNKKTYWYVNWSKFEDDVVIKALVLKGTLDIQGMIAMKDEPTAKAVHVLWGCTAPQNNIWRFGQKEYSGVGGHLFAIAGQYSVDCGYRGFIFGEGMDAKVTEYYIKEFNAEPFEFGYPPHPYRIIISENAMKPIMKEYDYEDSGKEI